MKNIEQINEQTNGEMVEWKKEWIKEQINRQMNEWRDEQLFIIEVRSNLNKIGRFIRVSFFSSR